MSRNPALVLFTALALIAPAKAFAQLTPPAGSAGAGNSSISGVPFGPANPRALSQRHRQRREYPAAPPQPSAAGRLLRLGRSVGIARTPRAAALYRRLAADHQRAPSLPAKTAGSAAGATGGEQFHGDLPGLLAIKLRSCGERTGISGPGYPEEQFSHAKLIQS